MVTEEFLEIGSATGTQLASRKRNPFGDSVSSRAFANVLQEKIEQRGDAIAHKSVEAFQPFYKNLEEKLENLLDEREGLLMEYNKLLFAFVHPEALQDKATRKQFFSQQGRLKKRFELEKEEPSEHSSVDETVAQLKDRLQAKNETVATLRDTIDKLREEITSLQQKQEEFSKKAEQEIESFQKRLEDKTSQIRDLRDVNRQLEQVIMQTRLGAVYSPIKKLGYATFDQIAAATGIKKPQVKRYVKSLTNTPLFRTEEDKAIYTGNV